MNNLTLKIECPELVQALNTLAAAMPNSGISLQAPPTEAVPPVQMPTYPPPTSQAANIPPTTGIPTAPTMPTNITPMPVAPVQTPQMPATPPVTIPPTAAPTYTIEQLQQAAAPIANDAGRVEELKGLLQKYGVGRVTDLPEAARNLFALDLRNMGAQI